MRFSDKFKEACEEEETRINCALNRIFDMLFWKNYSESYLTMDEKYSLIKLLNEFTYEDSEDGGYYKFNDEQKVTDFINGLRLKIGLDELP